MVINLWVGAKAGTYSFDDLQVDAVAQFSPPPPPPPLEAWRVSPPPPGTVALLSFEGTDDGVTSQQGARNGSWHVSVPDPRAAHSGASGLYVEVDKEFGWAPLAQLLLPRYVPRAGKETLLHLSFYARAQKLKATDPTPTIVVRFVDLQSSEAVVGEEVVPLSHSEWQMHYVVIDLKTAHVGHSIRPYIHVGQSRAIYHFDDFEYKEIEIEDGMEWLQAAPERIRKHRMGRFSLRFHDSDGWPIDYGVANVQLQRHDFPFGVQLRSRRETGFSSTDYVWYLTQAARHFWTGTIFNQMMWDEFEPSPGDVAGAKREVSELLTWMSRQGWALPAARIFDGGHSHPEHWSNKLTCGDLELHLRERLLRDLRESSGFGGRFGRYEVWTDAMKNREWIGRCGESLLFNAYKWAHQADPKAQLLTSEVDILSPRTLTSAEAYHNMVWEMAHNRDVPVGAIGVRCTFFGEVDASTVKHRLDVLHEVQLPIHLTGVALHGLDQPKQAYELEKLLRIAFSHPAVVGITLGDLWDRDSVSGGSGSASGGGGRPVGGGANGAGLYSANKQKKLAAQKLEALWDNEWSTHIEETLRSSGSVDFDGFYGVYKYSLRNGIRECAGEISLMPTEEDIKAGYYGTVNGFYSPNSGAGGLERVVVVQCNWKGHVHVPVWATPAIMALMFVGCLLGCYRKNAEHMEGLKKAREANRERSNRGPRKGGKSPRELPAPRDGGRTSGTARITMRA